MSLTVEYAGPYDRDLVWDEKAMDKWVRRGDVRTQINIRTRDRMPQPPGVYIQNALAIGKRERPVGSFIQEEQELFNISYDARNATGEVVIYPQRILDTVLEENDNFPDANDYAHKLNSVAKGGAKKIAVYEKNYRMENSAFGNPKEYPLFAFFMFCDTFCYSCFYQSLDYSNKLIPVINGMLSAIVTFYSAKQIKAEISNSKVNQTSLNSSYFQPGKDRTVFPHLYRRALLEIPSAKWVKYPYD